jgi:catalase
MSNVPGAPTEAAWQRLGMASTLARLALIGVALAAVIGTFAYFGGWFTPNDLTPARFTDVFERVAGVHPGFRRNHARESGFRGSLKAMAMASGSRTQSSFDRGACL